MNITASTDTPVPLMSFLAYLQRLQDKLVNDAGSGRTITRLRDLDLDDATQTTVHWLREAFNSSPLQVARLLECHVMYDTRNGRVFFAPVPFDTAEFEAHKHFHIIR